MLGLDMLDVAIGVIFLYLVLSLIATAAVEFIEMLLRYRARALQEGIADLLNDDDLLKKLYEHPLIDNLFRGKYEDAMKHSMAKRKLPAYIPARNFALALLDSLSVPLAGMTPADPTKPTAIDPAKVPNGTTGAAKAVAALINAAANDAAKSRENIEEWFNSSMDRVSGWYKARTQVWLGIIGIVSAAYLNVDSIEVATRLATDKNLREATVAAAEAYAKADAEASTKPAAAQPADAKSARAKLEAEVKLLNSLGLPIGWNEGTDRWGKWNKLYASKDRSAWLMKLVGLLITACAVSLGAPFWFDLLNKIIVVRSTVKPKEKSGIEAPKDPR